MDKKINAIVLNKINYSDSHDIVNLYSDALGRISVLSLKSKTGKNRNLLKNKLMQLSLIEANINYNPTKEIHRLKSYSIATPWQNIYFSPLKNAIGIFLSEFMTKILRDSVPDSDLWEFINSSLLILNNLDNEDAIKNFHLAFPLLSLRLLGLQPDVAIAGLEEFFDMRNGCYVAERPGHRDVIGGVYAPWPRLMMRMNYQNMRAFKFEKKERSRILDGILYYYSLHLPGVEHIKSPEILKDLL